MKPTRLTLGLIAGSLAALVAVAANVRIEPTNVASIVGYIGVVAVIAIGVTDYRLTTRRLTLK